MSSVGLKTWQYNSELLKHYISETGMSCQEISQKCGMWENTVSNILQGITYGSKSTWKNLSKYLGVDFRFDVRKVDVKQPVVKKKKKTHIHGVPLYVFHCLDKYGNTIVSKKIMKQISKQKFLGIMLAEGYDAVLKQDNDGDWIIKTK